MLPKDLSKYSVSDIERGFKTLKAENDARLKPLSELLSSGKKLTDAEERLMDQAGNLIDEFKLVERLKAIGDVARAANDLTNSEKATLEVLLLKADQGQPLDTAKALKCTIFLSISILYISAFDAQLLMLLYQMQR